MMSSSYTNLTPVKLGQQGVRQKGRSATGDSRKYLSPGDMFYSTRYPNKPELLQIPERCIGIIHDDAEEQISVIWDDCQAARRFRRKLAESYAKADLENLKRINTVHNLSV